MMHSKTSVYTVIFIATDLGSYDMERANETFKIYVRTLLMNI